jgi:hypothetical protein
MPDQKQKVRGDDPRLTAPVLRKDCRSVGIRVGKTAQDTIWQWKVGKEMVIIYSPDGTRYDAHRSTIFGLTLDEYEKIMGHETMPITPCDIQDYVKTAISGMKHRH